MMNNINQVLKSKHIETRAYINGCYDEGIKKRLIRKVSSYDGTPLPSITVCDKEDLDRAVKCARETFVSGVWKKLEPGKKKQIMLNLAQLMEEHREELAALDALETSRAFGNYYNDSIPKAIEAIRYFAEAVDKIYDRAITPREKAFATITREPLGVVGIITPWNDPMVVSAWKFAPALLMGNSVIIKPAEQSSLSIIKVAKLAELAGVPKGVFNVLPGYGEEIGKEIALHNDIDGVFFTGSSEVGKKIIQYSGQSNMKVVGLECGGKSPFIVSEKYKDISHAASVLAANMFYNQGQICSAPSRVLVNNNIKEKFIEYLKEECKKYIPGNPYEIGNNVGCLVSREQYDKVQTYITRAKNEKLEIYQASMVNDMPEVACCIPPTIVTEVSNDMFIAQEEVFGPVVVIIGFDNIDEAINIANDSKYGLAGAIFTEDLEEAYYVSNSICSGLVHINSYGEDDNMAPFGGFKQSGLGKDKSVVAFDEYSRFKTIWMKLGK